MKVWVPSLGMWETKGKGGWWGYSVWRDGMTIAMRTRNRRHRGRRRMGFPDVTTPSHEPFVEWPTLDDHLRDKAIRSIT